MLLLETQFLQQENDPCRFPSSFSHHCGNNWHENWLGQLGSDLWGEDRSLGAVGHSPCTTWILVFMEKNERGEPDVLAQAHFRGSAKKKKKKALITSLRNIQRGKHERESHEEPLLLIENVTCYQGKFKRDEGIHDIKSVPLPLLRLHTVCSSHRTSVWLLPCVSFRPQSP